MPAVAGSARAAFTSLQRRMLQIEREAGKELTKKLREIGNSARDVVRGSTEKPFRTGKTRKSVKVSVRQKGVVTLYSNLPQAPVWEWGGTIKPRGTPITIPQTNFVRGPIVAIGDDIDEQMADAFDEIAHRNGFL